MTVVLTEGQARAHAEVLEALPGKRGNRHLLVGAAGTGKTTLVNDLARSWLDRGLTVAACAPTHKAAYVLDGKLTAAGLPIAPMTVHALLSLLPDKQHHGEGLVFRRASKAKAVEADVVVIDECSMLGADLMRHIRRHLARCDVLFVGDPAQLPPVGEEGSQSFETKSRSELTEIVRQAAGNPIIQAATAIRTAETPELHPSWCVKRMAKPHGVFLPDLRGPEWLRKAFTSESASAEPDRFRYLCWTNARAASVNGSVRRWLYGERADESPLLPGERAATKGAIVRDDAVLMGANAEMTVNAIAADVMTCRFPDDGGAPEWSAVLPVWKVDVTADRAGEHTLAMVRDQEVMDDIDGRLKQEAARWPVRWRHRREFRERLAVLEPPYAMTVHCSQGSTFQTVFVDVPDILRRARANPRETLQLLYVAVTRASESVVLMGVREQGR